MINLIRIGTRESKLALWQAKKVRNFLDYNPLCQTELTLIKSEGDINLTSPLYGMGVQGIFTKSLDIALLEKRIDIAVHSYKDVPVQLAEGLTIAAVLKRGNPFDVLVCRNEQSFSDVQQKAGTLNIATSSIRRKSQWLRHYPETTIENVRGNVNTRLQKLKQSDWHGAIFAAAGLERLEMTKKETGPQLLLNWMLPAPAQGAIVVICRKNDKFILEACAALDDVETATCTFIERKFMHLMMGGCSTPISAYVTITNNILHFHGNITSTDGKNSMDVRITESLANGSTMAERAAVKMKEKGVENYFQQR